MKKEADLRNFFHPRAALFASGSWVSVGERYRPHKNGSPGDAG
jgi:hypothetical protein